MGNVRVKQARAVDRLLVNADNPISPGFEVRYDLMPACWIVPHLAAAGALHGDADVGLVNRRGVVLQGDGGNTI